VHPSLETTRQVVRACGLELTFHVSKLDDSSPAVVDQQLLARLVDIRRDAVEEDCIDELKAIVDRNLADLSQVEVTVIRRRFNWKQDEESPLTLEEVGQIIGVTKERVRQLEARAQNKLRKIAIEERLEAAVS